MPASVPNRRLTVCPMSLHPAPIRLIPRIAVRKFEIYTSAQSALLTTFAPMQTTLIRIVYFLLYAAFSSWMSFFYVFLKDEPGLTGVEIGAIAAIQQISSIFIVPIWGMLADRYGRKRIFTMALAVSSVAIFGFMYGQSFAYFLLFMLAFTFIYNPLTSLIDSIALDICENDPRVNYGQLRLWASIGWATSTLATGYYIKMVGISYIFPLAATLLVITWAVVVFLYRPITPKNLPKGISPKLVVTIIKENLQLLFFLALIVVFTIFSSPIHLFINLYYSEIGASSEQMGIAFAVQSICELPFFFYGNKIVERFGIKRTLVFTMIVTAVRMLLYSLTVNPTIAIIIGSSHGICLALYLVSMVSYVHRVVPPHLKSTGQSLIYTAMAAGICVGNMLTGYIKDVASIQLAMQMFFYAILIIAAVVLIVSPRIQRANSVAAVS